ncbi:RICIN domain-containing protein [Archangium violaceum]|uniref:RICIN domain-containing protein n=1 Tax=Archangium violaceum TaxID=83451 RepID=UPI001951F50F|nr:RICIN domain-containing protein [Archangium violaceum]QRO01887.1 RICIN domain-containing protein [Archangium violaceum]
MEIQSLVGRLSALALLVGAGCAAPENSEEEEVTSASLQSPSLASGSTAPLVSAASGKCVGVKGSSTADSALLELQTCSGSTFQQWTVTQESSGYFSFKNVGSGKCVDVTGFSTSAGTQLQQYNCSGNDNQKWTLTDQSGGSVSIVSKLSGLAMDVKDSQTADGTAIIQHYWNGTPNQLWKQSAGSGSSSAPVGFGASVTGGQGGTVVTVSTPAQLKAALCGSEVNGVCQDTTRRIVQLSTVIDFRGTEGTKTSLGCTYSHNNCSVNGKYERILNFSSYCSGRSTYNITYDAAGQTPLLVGSNKTLIGIGANAGIKGKGLIVKGGTSNVIIRNLSITDINEGIIWAGDAITLDNASRVWIDHDYFARIGRQMIVTGWGTAQNVTISNNFFDGTTDYGHYCNGKHYWVMLLVGENQTITLAGNKIYNTSGRSPELGKQSSAASGGTVHIVNNYYDGNYYMGIGASDDVVSLIEGNYFSTASYFFPIFQSSTNKVFAPLDSNLSTANGSCKSALGRNCAANYATNSTGDFQLNSSVISAINASSTLRGALGSVVPSGYSSVPSHKVGPQADPNK